MYDLNETKIFISYHLSNEKDTSKLEQILIYEGFTVWRRAKIASEVNYDSIDLFELKNSAIALVLLNPNYIKNEECIKESLCITELNKMRIVILTDEVDFSIPLVDLIINGTKPVYLYKKRIQGGIKLWQDEVIYEILNGIRAMLKIPLKFKKPKTIENLQESTKNLKRFTQV